MSSESDATNPGQADHPLGASTPIASSAGDDKTDSQLTTTVRRRAERLQPTNAAYLRPNMRRSTLSSFQFWLLFAFVIASQILTGLFYFIKIKPALMSYPGSRTHSPTESSSMQEQADGVPLPEAMLTQIATATAQIQELQKQLDSLRTLQIRHEEVMQSLTDRVTQTHPNPGIPQGAGVSTPASAGIDSREMETSSLDTPPVLAGTTELRLMKERNRLTSYADEAISTGNRRTLNLIVDAMRDPDRATLFHAAQAEYYRVVVHYQMLSRIDPGYKLAVSELFPGEKLRDEADLRTSQIIELLKDQDKDWRARLRAAYLLTGRRTPEVGDALVAALREDPNLDVAKEAQLSFESTFGRRFLLFDLPGIEAWWQTQTAVRSSRGAGDPPATTPETVR